MALNRKEVRIAVMGATGSGKSTFINRASDSELVVGESLESCTLDVATSKPFLLDDCIVTLIDTPGFDDTVRKDTAHPLMHRRVSGKLGTKLAGIVYMHRITDIRMGGTSTRNFRMFRELCGEKTLRNVLIVTNMWETIDLKRGEAREHELKSNEKFFKPAIEKEARMLRHAEDTKASAHVILRHVINNKAMALQIQDEIVNQKKDLAHTAAGAELAHELTEQAKRHEEEMQKIREEMAAALRAKDEETRAELQRELDKGREEIERIKHSAENMKSDFAAQKSRLESKIAQMETENHGRVKGLEEKLAKVHKNSEEQEARLLEERNARLAAEQQHQADIRSLMERGEAANNLNQADIGVVRAERLRIERERAEAENRRAEEVHAQNLQVGRDRAEAEMAKFRTDRELAEAEKRRTEAEAAKLKTERELIEPGIFQKVRNALW